MLKISVSFIYFLVKYSPHLAALHGTPDTHRLEVESLLALMRHQMVIPPVNSDVASDGNKMSTPLLSFTPPYLRLVSGSRMGQAALLYSSVAGQPDLPTFIIRM